jgi:hypothetical protein
MAEVIYLLCAVASTACVVLLGRSWRRQRTGLLLSSLLGFTALAANNCLLFIDLTLFPSLDLALLRNGTALLAVVLLLAGLIWETA